MDENGPIAVPAALERLAGVLHRLDRKQQAWGESLYDAVDASDMVRATVTGRGRLVGLQLDDRLLNLQAGEVAERINQTLWTALDLAEETIEAESPAVQAAIAEALADAAHPP